jgi:hypothetical protein
MRAATPFGVVGRTAAGRVGADAGVVFMAASEGLGQSVITPSVT